MCNSSYWMGSPALGSPWVPPRSRRCASTRATTSWGRSGASNVIGEVPRLPKALHEPSPALYDDNASAAPAASRDAPGTRSRSGAGPSARRKAQRFRCRQPPQLTAPESDGFGTARLGGVTGRQLRVNPEPDREEKPCVDEQPGDFPVYEGRATARLNGTK